MNRTSPHDPASAELKRARNTARRWKELALQYKRERDEAEATLEAMMRAVANEDGEERGDG